jgi:hypothetical protein
VIGVVCGARWILSIRSRLKVLKNKAYANAPSIIERINNQTENLKVFWSSLPQSFGLIIIADCLLPVKIGNLDGFLILLSINHKIQPATGNFSGLSGFGKAYQRKILLAFR